MVKNDHLEGVWKMLLVLSSVQCSVYIIGRFINNRKRVREDTCEQGDPAGFTYEV